MRARSRTATPLTTPSGAVSPSTRRGLYAYVGHRVVELLTEPQLVDHAVSVLPQLHSVTTRPHFHGPHWTTLRKKHGVELYEFDPAASGAALAPVARRGSGAPAPPSSTVSSSRSTAPTDSWLDGRPPSTTRTTLPHGFQTQYKLPNPGIDMSYAVVAQCELDGHVNDVIDVLFNDEPIEFEASMKTLWGNKLKRGDLLLSRSVQGRSLTILHNNTPTPDVSGAAHIDDLAVPLPGTLAIKTATVGAGLSFTRKSHGAEKLCYSSFTQCSPRNREAFHVVKTLPLHIHDQIACGKTHVALRDPSVDHIAVGYHLTSMESVLGGARTRLVICAYASAISSTTVSRASQLHWHPRMGGNVRMSLGSSTRDSVHADVRRVVLMLAKAARAFQQAVRQRRLGSQRFVYFPTDRSSGRVLEQSCVVCLRRFGLFRKDHYCQLCAHLVCRQCSKKHKVEPFAGKVRENRICFPCVARVDTSAFHDEQLWKNMDRPVVVDSETISPLAFDAFEVIIEGDDKSLSRQGSKLTNETVALQRHETAAHGLDRSYGSTRSGRPPRKSSATQCEIQVAHDLFSPHPNRRASALEALSRAVLEARHSTDSGSFKRNRSRRGMDPALVEMYHEEKLKPCSSLTSRYDDDHKPTDTTTTATSTTPASTKSDHMQLFSVCYPRANPTAVPSLVAAGPRLHGSSPPPLPFPNVVGRASQAAAVIDTVAFDSICEAAVERLDFALAFIAIKRRSGSRQIIGLHHASSLGVCVSRHADLASNCPVFVASADTTAMTVVDPMLDIRFRYFALVHEARMRFFAQFPLAGVSAARGDVVGASLCVLDVNARNQSISKEEFVTVATLCAVASDLVNCIGK